MPTIVTQAKNVAHYNSEGVLIRDVSDQLYKVNPDSAPFQVFMRELSKKKEAKSTKVEWLKTELVPTVTAVNNGAGYTDVASTIIVDNEEYGKIGNVVLNVRTGEQFRITAVTAGASTWDITRGFGVTAAAAMLDNDVLLILGSAFGERSGAATIRSAAIASDYNFTQIFKTAFGLSGTAKAVTSSGGTYGGDNASLQKEQRAIEHQRAIELQMLFGERKEDTGGADPIRAMGGLREFVTDNLKSVGGNLTESVFKAWIRDLFEEARGSDTRILICDPLIAEAVSFWSQGKVQTKIDDKRFGMAITEYFTNFGKLIVKPHWMFTSTYGENGSGFAIDPQYVAVRPLATRDTQIQYNVHDAGTDQQVDQFLTEVSLEVAAPEVHGKIYGVTSYS